MDAHFETWTAQIGWTARLEYALLGGLEAKPPEADTISGFNRTLTLKPFLAHFLPFLTSFDHAHSLGMGGEGTKSPEAGGIRHIPTDT